VIRRAGRKRVGVVASRGFGTRGARAGSLLPLAEEAAVDRSEPESSEGPSLEPVTVFLCGDVMIGRGIDQVLPHPSDPVLHESYVKDAGGYVALAERANGPIPRPVDRAYPWGDALEELSRIGPDARVVNLETSVTRSDHHWPGKGIHYRMNPANVPCLTAAKIDCCALANNHVLDWGPEGLVETLETLRGAGVKAAGAGRTREEAEAPAVIDLPGRRRVVVFSLGAESSGIPLDWAASPRGPGVSLLPDLSPRTVRRVARKVRGVKRPGDVVVVSVHWGSNWGYGIPREQTEFARGLVDEAGVDVVHGHSSHHVRPIEVYGERLILYGCGDFINDYEGIGGFEEFRGDLSLMYFATLRPATGQLLRLRMKPMRMRRFRVNRASPEETRWLRDVLNREGGKFGTGAELGEDGELELRWG
jgi:poly-gamma-glutamate synthesis protein (capsule biosynthesis protein)